MWATRWTTRATGGRIPATGLARASRRRRVPSRSTSPTRRSCARCGSLSPSPSRSDMAASAPVLEPPPPPRTPARRRWFLRVLALLGILVLAIAAGIGWLLHSQGGARFVLERVARMAGGGGRVEGGGGG